MEEAVEQEAKHSSNSLHISLAEVVIPEVAKQERDVFPAVMEPILMILMTTCQSAA
jgi:hypothetical protein